MALGDVIDAGIILVKGSIKLAMLIRDKEEVNRELKTAVHFLSMELTVAGGLLTRLKRVVNQVNTHDESIVTQHINILNKSIEDAKEKMEDVSRDRSFIKRLFMKQDEYRRDIRELNESVHRICTLIENAIPRIEKRVVPNREFKDFRRQFRETPEKRLYYYDIFTIRDGSSPAAAAAAKEVEERKSVDNFDKDVPCYMNVNGENIIFSHQLRTWCAALPKDFLLARRLEEFRQYWQRDDLRGSNTSLNSVSSTESLPPVPRPLLVPRTSLATPERSVSLDFSELSMAYDSVCGIALANEHMYIATTSEITIVSLISQQVVAQIGTKGEGNNAFNRICHLYISGDDDPQLYVVDRDQRAVHVYHFDDGGRRLEFVRRFLVIADLKEEPNLVSCVVFNKRLYVSDNGNDCLHLFSLRAQHQECCLHGDSLTPFIPGSLCVAYGYLFVANCSQDSPGILVFDEDVNPVAWFRNEHLKHILAMYVCPNANELFVLSVTNDPIDSKTNEKRQRPIIVSMNASVKFK